MGIHGGLWGDMGPMLGLTWAHVGSFGGLCGAPWRSLE